MYIYISICKNIYNLYTVNYNEMNTWLRSVSKEEAVKALPEANTGRT